MNEKFFNELPTDLLKDSDTSSEVIFNAFNTSYFDSTVIKNRDNYVKSLIRPVGFAKEVPIDNCTLETFFCDEESATSKTMMNISIEDEEKLTEIRFIIHNLLPDFERDIMTLIFDYNKIQEDIGVLLGLSQEMVNYYKKRAIHRILHFYHHRKIDVNDMRECIASHVSKRQLEAMMLYFFRHNQRVISKELKISQSAVSARLKQGLKKLKKKAKHDKKAQKYYEIFSNLAKQKSLYSSQTRMKMITDVDNYKQFDENNQRITTVQVIKEDKKVKEPKIDVEEKVKKVKVKKDKKVKEAKIVKEKVKKEKPEKKRKSIKFNRGNLKNIRLFFKR